ncbi:complex I subunit 4 family protein [Cytophaga hutchinsonii]|uniref:NADH dehydrogenase subunit M n=1 Tax=Cytophaga hutchinsonii (strain ATCC 33406 / DSM 1761 / CIP 103989 / NBRC 15051 / NCIMB 9469 / D465) TaxID=269798 RepID=A0A6N4SQK2_CYTH3|nr:NADH-quinone oxidoreductase subunit M [Cytophaga hutchinsonii]ABG58642.1 NADH dehydrogenase subunit M [Cytophaga hutchinsonii ATCC 33406]SFX58661.1 NADH dehydrogenase subunit M [Cytophaga hutchinsonii ATCC 33406]
MITTLLIFFPLVAALIVFIAGQRMAPAIGIIATLIEFALGIFAYVNFDAAAGWNYEIVLPWISTLNINYAVGMDGISLALVLLTTFLLPLILLASLSGSLKNKKGFYVLALIMQSALIGVFTSKDLFLFYIFWELALIPIYFICLLWGDENRKFVTFKFFIYTLFGSLIMLAAIIYLYSVAPVKSFAMENIYNTSLTTCEQVWIFAALFLAFGIKMPVFPLHTWQPSTYTSAPVAGTMLLSGIMLKMGIYGVIRWILPVLPTALMDWGWLAMLLAIIGIIYASIIAIKQSNYKTLIAYVSIAHVGLIAAGLFTNSVEGLQGVIAQMLAHGVNVVGILFVVEILLNRTGTLEIAKLGGLRNQMPQFAVFFVVIMMASIALPSTNGFVGEFLLFVGIFNINPYLAAVAGITIILGAVYMLSSYQKIMLGEARSEYDGVVDLTLLEKSILIPIVIVIFVLGLFPNLILDLTEPAVNGILHSVHNSIPVAN